MEHLLASESDRIEWKSSPTDQTGICQAVVAMANDFGDSRQPGYVVVGLDKRGKALGLGKAADGDELQQRVSNWLRSTKVMPTPVFDLREWTTGGQSLLVITVDPYPVPPVVAYDGHEYIRQGTTTRRATQADLARLRERRPENQRPFDQRLVLDATLADLDASTLRAEYEVARIEDGSETLQPFESWLSHRQLGALRDGDWRPNAAALLAYGVDPQRFMPGARVEFVRFGGVDADSPVASRKSISGPAPRQLDTLWAQLDANLASSAARSEGVVESFLPDYPPDALKETARNLLQHRIYEGTHAPARVEWYDDRIEFSNPGGPFGRASEGEFGEHSDYRNPTLTRLLVELGYVQQLGRGVRRVRRHLERNGNPPLEVQTDGFTRLILRARK